jgi:hypothetical protein
MRPGMELKELKIEFPPSDEEADGTMLAYCVGSIEWLFITGPERLVNVTSWRPASRG